MFKIILIKNYNASVYDIPLHVKVVTPDKFLGTRRGSDFNIKIYKKKGLKVFFSRTTLLQFVKLLCNGSPREGFKLLKP